MIITIDAEIDLGDINDKDLLAELKERDINPGIDKATNKELIDELELRNACTILNPKTLADIQKAKICKSLFDSLTLSEFVDLEIKCCLV